MKSVLKRKGTCIPYGGMYVWRDPLTKVEVRGTHWEMLIARINEERRANSVPIGLGLEDEVEADLCRDYPAECELNDPRWPRKLHRLEWHTIMAGTKLLAQFKLQGSPTVDPIEAQRRAEICSTCPFNIEFNRPCAGICAELESLVISIIGQQRTPVDEKLKSCSVCGCFLRAAVWLPVDLQRSVLTDEQKTQYDNVPFCWKRKP